MLFFGVVALVHAEDSRSGDSATPSIPAGPPRAKVAPVEDIVQGHKIADRYRYLENPNDPDTKLYVEQELSYTRALLDPLPGRDKINARLAQLLEIGSVGAPQMGGKYYFHTRREGNQNQPILYVREGLQGDDRVLVDVNKLAADGTTALDWWYVSDDGKYVAYGTSASGSA
jgi:prolyl oligopeptidase